MSVQPYNHLLIIMQGVPGSGKSTLARMLKERVYDLCDCVIYSTDDYHIEPDGTYQFKLQMVSDFHRFNKERAALFIHAADETSDRKVLIIDNTNIKLWEATPYVVEAVRMNAIRSNLLSSARRWDIQFIRCTGEWASIHNVPDWTIERMKATMDNLTVEGCINLHKG